MEGGGDYSSEYSLTLRIGVQCIVHLPYTGNISFKCLCHHLCNNAKLMPQLHCLTSASNINKPNITGIKPIIV